MTLPKRVVDAANEYKAWLAEYKPTGHEVTVDSIALCEGLDERLVWTFHLDPNGQMVTNGFWDSDEALEFYVSEIPWSGNSGDICYFVEIYDTCDVCKGAGGDCNECRGKGSKNYFVD